MGWELGRTELLSQAPSFPFKLCNKEHVLLLKLKWKQKHLSWKPLREGFSDGQSPMLGQRRHSQVRDARRLHLRQGGPVGPEGRRAVDQCAVLSQALGRGGRP